MLRFLQVLAVLLVAVTMALSLAHALEFPGKMRLGRETYLAVQQIYYPGFTIGGMAEPASILAILALLLLGPRSGTVFWRRSQRSARSSPRTRSTGSSRTP